MNRNYNRPNIDELRRLRHRRMPTVAIVGRPNVGKSRLFNRFIRKRSALVEDTPGVTRDRNYSTTVWEQRRFRVIDTGGFEPDSPDLLLEQMREQAQLAIEEADIIILVVDSRTGLLPTDEQIADMLRRSGKRVILAVNKIDAPRRLDDFYDFASLGFEESFPISAEHGVNFDDLVDAVIRDMVPEEEPAPSEALPLDQDSDDGSDADAGDDDALADDPDFDPSQDDDLEGDAGPEQAWPENALDALPPEDPEELLRNACIQVAIVGKPNTGKSTLINRLVGSDRLLTAEIAGTTRDAIDTELWTPDERCYILIDTAGIRRKRSITARLEKFSVVKALDAVERADVVLLTIDATTGPTDQDLRIAGLAIDNGRALGILLNKWDLVTDKDSQSAPEAIKRLRQAMPFCDHAPVMTISGLTGQRTHKILNLVDKLYVEGSKRVPTGELNRVFERIIHDHSPPTVGSRIVKMYFAAQVAVRPPTFLIQTNAPEIVPASYKRYLSNQFRAYYGFEGSPLRLIFRRPAGRRRWKQRGKK